MNIKNTIQMGLWALSLSALPLACSDTEKRDAVQPESRLNVEPAEVVFPKEGGEQTFSISSNRGWALEKTDGVWYDIVGELMGQDTAKVITLKAAANEGVASRNSKLTVKAGSAEIQVAVSQFGSQAEIMLPLSNIAVGYNDTVVRVVVNANVEVEAVADEGIKVEKLVQKTAMSLVSQIFAVTIPENRNVTEVIRKVTFSAQGTEAKVLTITQGKFVATVTCSELFLTPGSIQTEARLTVTSNVPWTAAFVESNPEGIEFDGVDNGGIGITVLKFKLTENQTPMPRKWKFTISYSGGEPLTYEIVQAGAGKTRERDSSLLVALWKAATVRGTASGWDFNTPLTEWRGVGMNARETEVTFLSMNGWSFPQALPEEIGGLIALRELEISNCTFGQPQLPATLGNLTLLTELSFWYLKSPIELPDMSGLTKVKTLVIRGEAAAYGGGDVLEVRKPENIATLTGLTRLELDGTALTAFPDNLMNIKSLTFLSARQSKLAGLQPGLANLTNLTTLILSGCGMTGNIPAELFVGTSLETVDFGENQLEGTLPVEMFKLETLTDLRLTSNNLTGEIPEELLTSNINKGFSVRMNRLGTFGKQNELNPLFMADHRWPGSAGAGGGGWFGADNICVQQENWGWSNCDN